MAVTVRQIAARANVSPSTVSRVLNQYPYVNQATRDCVLLAAQDLGYITKAPQPTARQSRTVLVLMREIGASTPVQLSAVPLRMYNDIWQGIEPPFARHGITPHLWGTSMHPQEAHRYVTELGIAGLVFMGGVVNHDFLRELQNVHMPFIIVGAHTNPLPTNCVMPDYLDGMQQSIAHLAEVGRRRIGLVNGPATTTSSDEKYRGFRLGLALHNLPFLDAISIANDFDAESGYVATIDLLQRCAGLDAIVYASDAVALGGLRALKELGRRSPDDIAVTGFYDYEIARFTVPPLTSVHVDWVLAGKIAALRFCTMMEEQDDLTWASVMPVSLVVRASSSYQR